MMTFMEAMNDYRLGVVSKDPKLTQRIEAAVRTLNLDGIPVVVRSEKGRKIAILLKEVIEFEKCRKVTGKAPFCLPKTRCRE